MRPSYRLIIGLLLLSLVAVLFPDVGALRWVLGAVAAGALVDALLGYWASGFTVRRQTAHNLPVNQFTTVNLDIGNDTELKVHASVQDEVSEDAQVSSMPPKLWLPSHEVTRVTYSLKPTRRGDLVFGDVVLMVRSPLGLWERRLRFPQQVTTVRVYPDFSVIAEYLMLVADQHINRLGLRITPRRGEGLEFRQLREYRPGDAIRQIDWKATARRQDLISKEYQEERDQRVLFLMDSGRRMRTKDGDMSHFDQSLNAMLLLAFVALRQGDLVGVQSFGAVRKSVDPLRGVASVNVLLNEVYDLHTGPEASDYISAAESLMAHHRKRSLVVLMTSLRETDTDLISALRLLTQRHVVLLASLRETILDDYTDREPRDFTEALRVAGTHKYMEQRRDLQSACLPFTKLVVDCAPAELPVQVVNAYWQIKRSGEL